MKSRDSTQPTITDRVLQTYLVLQIGTQHGGQLLISIYHVAIKDLQLRILNPVKIELRTGIHLPVNEKPNDHGIS